MNTNTTLKEMETLIDKLEKSESQLDRARISQAIKFILCDFVQMPKTSESKEPDSNRINACLPLSEIITSLFVVSNYGVEDGQVFSSHLDYLQKSIQKLRSVPSYDT